MAELVLFTISQGNWELTARSCENIVTKYYIGIEGVKENKILYDSIPFFVVGVGNLIEKGFDGLRNTLLKYIPVGDWCLMLDDDEVLEGYTNLSRVVKTDMFYAYMLHLHQWHLQANKQNIFSKDTLYRLFKKVPGLSFQGKVHEQIVSYYKKNNLPFGGSIPGGRIIHFGYDIDKDFLDKKIQRNMYLLWQNIWNEKLRDGYDYYHLGEMRIWYHDYGGALEAYERAIELGLHNPKLVEKAKKQINSLRKIKYFFSDKK